MLYRCRWNWLHPLPLPLSPSCLLANTGKASTCHRKRGNSKKEDMMVGLKRKCHFYFPKTAKNGAFIIYSFSLEGPPPLHPPYGWYVIFFLQERQQHIVYHAFCLGKDNQFTLIELTALPAATSMSSPLPILVLKYSYIVTDANLTLNPDSNWTGVPHRCSG